MKTALKAILILAMVALMTVPLGCAKRFGSSRDGNYRISAYDEAGYPLTCKVYIDGTYMGETPWKGILPPESKTVELKHWLYPVWTGELHEKAGGMVVVMKRDLDAMAALCDDGSAFGCFMLSEAILANEGGEAVASQLFSYQRKAASLALTKCDGGDGEDCGLLALMYLEEKGRAKSIDKAREYGEVACKADSALGCYALGRADVESGAVTDETRIMLEKGCAAGYTDACGWLGEYYFVLATDADGRNETAKAHTLRQQGRSQLDEACQLGSGYGCARLGALYFKNIQQAESLYLAKPVLEKGCKLGAGTACYYYGRLVAGGGTDLPSEESARFYSRACFLGYKNACSEGLNPE